MKPETTKDTEKHQGFLFTTKGLHVRRLDSHRFVVEDVFGTCSMPCHYQDEEHLGDTLLEEFRVRALAPVEESGPISSMRSFHWDRLEYFFVAHLDYAFLRYLLRPEELDTYWAEVGMMPLGFLDLGHGEGQVHELQALEAAVAAAAKENKLPFSVERLNVWLLTQEVKRICSELMSLLHRAIRSFFDLLNIQRTCITRESGALSLLGSNELVHSSALSYRAATATTICAITLCTTLDLASKLVHFLDGIDPSQKRYRPAGGKQYHLLKTLNCKRLPQGVVEKLAIVTAAGSLSELIQLRHDLVHSTSALVLEKIYVGNATGEINGMPLFYSYQPWRDCTDTGQPVRHLGRDYFTGDNRDMEHRLFTWLHEIVAVHLELGTSLHDFLNGHPADVT